MRFIDNSDNGGDAEAAALRELGFDIGPGLRQRHRRGRDRGCNTVEAGAAALALSALLAASFAVVAAETSAGFVAVFWSFRGSTCGNSFAIFSDGRSSGNGILRPRA